MPFRRLKQHAHAVMNDAQATAGDARQLLALAMALLEEIEDGVDFTLYNTSDTPPLVQVKQFLEGNLKEFSFGVRVKPRGEDQDPTTQSEAQQQ